MGWDGSGLWASLEFSCSACESSPRSYGRGSQQQGITIKSPGVQQQLCHSTFNIYLFIYVFIYREGEGRKKYTHVRKKHRLVASRRHPDRGPNLQPGIEPVTFLLCGMMPNQLSHTGQSCYSTYIVSKALFSEALTLWQLCMLKGGWNVLRGLCGITTVMGLPIWD